ncbi:MAG: hypothetical protein HQ579_04500 [Candidatus Omnitrophica bacterium]|nr:hypothetical protein [Candidatus Omnitrophota bacterium]
MIGFLLHIDSTSKNPIKMQSEDLDLIRTTTHIQDNSLFLFKNSVASSVELEGYSLYVVGTLIYKKNWNTKALELIAHDFANGMTTETVALNARGQYCLIIYRQGKVTIITDKLASFPIYKYEKGNTVKISNIFPLLAEKNNVTFNFYALAEFISHLDGFSFDSTFFKEIEHLDGGTIYEFGDQATSKCYYDVLKGIEFDKYRDLDSTSNEIKEMLIENLSFFRPKDRIFADLTGGFDSRVVVTILKANGTVFDAGICGDQTPHESQIARNVAYKMNVKFREDFRIDSYEKFKHTLELHHKISNGIPELYHSTELINYYTDIKKHYDMHITGFGGTELFTLDQQVVRLFTDTNGEIDIDSYLRTCLKHIDVLKDEYMEEMSYYNILRLKLAEVVEKLKCRDSRFILTPITLSSYSRFFHGSLIGTHNCIVPHYSPYLEANIAKKIMEVSPFFKYAHAIQKNILSNINPEVAALITTHGYAANDSSRNILNSLKSYAKKILKIIANKNNLLKNYMYFLRNYIKNKLKSKVQDRDRLYWVKEMKGDYSDTMPIFELINKNKYKSAMRCHKHKNRFMARVVYLNKLMEKCNPKQ